MRLWFMICHPYDLRDKISRLFDGMNIHSPEDLVSMHETWNAALPNRTYEVTILFNYENHGPLVFLLGPGDRYRVMVGYHTWKFGDFHFRYFTGMGRRELDPRSGLPLMRYPNSISRGGRLKGILTLCISKFAEDYEVEGGLIKRITRFFRKFDRGRRLTIFGWKPYSGEDLLLDVQRTIRKMFGIRGLERIWKLFTDHGIYFTPSAICSEFQEPLNRVWEFLCVLDMETRNEDPERYFLRIGFQ